MNKELQKRDPDELLIMGGCPQCGLEVNEKFVMDLIDGIRQRAYEQGKKDLVDKEEAVIEAVIEAVDRERERIRSIIKYICNKNSKTIAEGGFNHAQFLMDIEELERELAE